MSGSRRGGSCGTVRHSQFRLMCPRPPWDAQICRPTPYEVRVVLDAGQTEFPKLGRLRPVETCVVGDFLLKMLMGEATLEQTSSGGFLGRQEDTSALTYLKPQAYREDGKTFGWSNSKYKKSTTRLPDICL
ncbi:hypothetical protein BaRGS_00021724 [Batillaria attramentaria]|uniref:Uncharacterized protein n=1 Tax=Batillaria attramentaria TaxID=370345 RepID=A0ABD0KIP7_9CAEN